MTEQNTKLNSFANISENANIGANINKLPSFANGNFINIASQQNMPTGNMPINNMPMGNMPINNMQNMTTNNMSNENMSMNNMPKHNSNMGNMQIGNIPVNNIPMGNMPINNMPMNNLNASSEANNVNTSTNNSNVQIGMPDFSKMATLPNNTNSNTNSNTNYSSSGVNYFNQSPQQNNSLDGFGEQITSPSIETSIQQPIMSEKEITKESSKEELPIQESENKSDEKSTDKNTKEKPKNKNGKGGRGRGKSKDKKEDTSSTDTNNITNNDNSSNTKAESDELTDEVVNYFYNIPSSNVSFEEATKYLKGAMELPETFLEDKEKVENKYANIAIKENMDEQEIRKMSAAIDELKDTIRANRLQSDICMKRLVGDKESEGLISRIKTLNYIGSNDAARKKNAVIAVMNYNPPQNPNVIINLYEYLSIVREMALFYADIEKKLIEKSYSLNMVYNVLKMENDKNKK